MSSDAKFAVVLVLAVCLAVGLAAAFIIPERQRLDELQAQRDTAFAAACRRVGGEPFIDHTQRLTRQCLGTAPIREEGSK